ncbi:MAG: hypothetical protein K0R66_1171 [Gammaproteobacteria bacterium]|nr:hypothetical protein [Gammaproteobacteria bacterium]
MGANVTRFFRGHADEDYGLLPSIFRNSVIDKTYTTKAKDEYKLLEEYKKGFNKFYTQPTYNLLCDMQHHGIPTRLIDWTTNPLIALYFSCCSSPDKNGLIFIQHQAGMHAPAKMSDHPIYLALHAEIAAVNNKQEILPIFMKHFEDYKAYWSSYLKRLTRRLTHPTAKPNYDGFLKRAHNEIDRFIVDSKLNQAFKKRAMNLNINQLIHFGNFMNGLGILHFLYAPQLNERVIAQHGAFSICTGKILKNKVIIRTLGLYPSDLSGEGLLRHVIIPKEQKAALLNQLEKYFNINAFTLKLKSQQEIINENRTLRRATNQKLSNKR